ncbi:hypothetical protein SteCoe_18677 [Stentor coeruleus]|uniref:SYO1-like TPR repeats domain-containing protein n=1 Tax=Stentor coeruleus TaxID=5963 RepID=A0A1R2BW03_9CILI|nr:hypothetical protein SteCoe_18677 [Stentor coeruleus]
MVKSRLLRDKSARFNPLKAKQTELLKENIPSSVISKQLRSGESLTRELACIAVANLPSLPEGSDILKLIVERITDTEPAVQAAALHAAINLSESYWQDLLNLGIIQILKPIISTYIIDEHMFSNKQEKQICHSLVSNALYLLSALGIECEALLEEFSTGDLFLQCVHAVMSKNKTLALPAIDLLTLCVESNYRVSQKLVAEYSFKFFGLIRDLESEMKMAVVGLMSLALQETKNYDEIFKYALPIVLDMISVDIHEEFLMNVSTRLADNNFKAQEHFWILEARAQQTSLETLTNLLSVDEDEEPLVLNHLTSENIKFIARSASGVTKDMLQSLFTHPELISTMLSLQCSAFSCIQNLILNTSCLSNHSNEIWVVLIDNLDRALEFSEEETEFQENLIELLEIVSKNMCAICKKYPDSIAEKIYYIPLVLQGIYKENIEASENLLGVLSVLGKEQLSLQTAEEIARVLVKCCGNEEIEIATEALNVFFDVFCDERYDIVLENLGVVDMMSRGIDGFRKKIRQCQDDEVREHAEEAYENLVEFVKYKIQHQRENIR